MDDNHEIIDILPLPLSITHKRFLLELDRFRQSGASEDLVWSILSSYSVQLRFVSLIAVSDYATRASNPDLNRLMLKSLTAPSDGSLLNILERVIQKDGSNLIMEDLRTLSEPLPGQVQSLDVFPKRGGKKTWIEGVRSLVRFRNDLLHGVNRSRSLSRDLVEEYARLYIGLVESPSFLQRMEIIAREGDSVLLLKGETSHPIEAAFEIDERHPIIVKNGEPCLDLFPFLVIASG